MSTTTRLPFDEINQAAAGRWAQILTALTPLSGDVLTKAAKDHPCPLCGGASTIWPASDAETTGRIACRKCTNNRPTGDGIATVAVWAGLSQGDAARGVADFLGLTMAQRMGTRAKATADLIAQVCADKRMPVDAFRQFGPSIETRGRNKNPVVRVPVWNERGEQHSYFDFASGHKGWFARGKGMAGLFLPGRLPAPDGQWLLCEGVKDCAALVGLAFNAAGLPTSEMADKYARLFTGCHVILVPDLDSAGQAGAAKSGGRLIGIAASVRVARLPGEIVEKSGDDVRDVLRRPDGERLVREAIDAAAPWVPRAGEIDPKDGRPEVLLTLAYRDCVDQVTEHLGRLGWQTPWIPEPKRERLKLYQRGGVIVHVIATDKEIEIPGGIVLPVGSVRIRPLPPGQLPLRIADACQLVAEKETADGIERKAAPPPRWLVDGVYSRGEYGRDVRALEGVITAPTLRSDGTVLQKPGYDEKTGLLLRPNAKFPPVPNSPTRDDAAKAAAELVDIVADFHFSADADKSAWLALLLTMVGRPMVRGCCPMFTVSATCRGSGKTLLIDAAGLIAYGNTAPRKNYTSDPEELRKIVTAVAIESLPLMMLDNIDRQLRGAALDNVLTAHTIQERILGKSETTGELPMRTIWTATGNNLTYGGDIARRVLPIRLVPKVENPEDRTDFTHANLLAWVADNRPRLAVLALTVLRGYFAAGCPKQPGGTWGSFESWHSLIRGSIVWAELPDPMTTRETAKADDTSAAVVRGLIGGLLEIDKSGDGMTVREIVAELNDANNASRFSTLREVVCEVATYKGRPDGKKLGYAFRQYKGRISKGWTIATKLGRGGVHKWFAERVNGCDGCDGCDTFPPLYAGEVCVSPENKNTHENQYGNGPESSQPSQPSQPSAEPDECQHVWQDTAESDGRTRRFCTRCCQFGGFVLADGSTTLDIPQGAAR